MNNLYINQLETENKQLRLALQETRKALEEKTKAINKAISFVKEFEYYIPEDDKPELLEILGEKENE